MKKTIQLFSILLLVMLIQSCSKTDPCPKGQENYYNLTDEEKSKIPYTGTDTLVFISDKGDTATLIGQGKSQSYKRTTSGGNPDCQISYNYDNYELLTYSYLGTNLDLKNIQFVARRFNSKYIYMSYYDCDINAMFKFNYGIYESHDTVNYKDTILYRNSIIKCLKLSSYTDSTTNYYFNNLFGIVKVGINNKIFIKK